MDRTTLPLAALVAAALLAPQPAAAQPIVLRDGRAVVGEDDAPADGRRLFVTDRELSQRLREATDLLVAQKYAAAIARLQFLLDRPEDVFFQPDADNPSHFLSLKAEVQRLVAALPAEGRRLYEAQYAESARRLLDDAVAAGDTKGLEEVVRRFFHTEAGYEAMYLLATTHLDRGQPLAAALHFDRLRKIPAAARRWEPLLSLKAAVGWGRAGLPAESRRTLLALKDTHGQRPLTLGGRTVEWFRGDEDALPWLASTLEHDRQLAAIGSEDWTMFRGNTARNAGGSLAAPLWQVAWSVSTMFPDDPGDTPGERFREAALELEQIAARHRKSGSFLTVPAAAPIVTGGAVVFRTPRNVRAVDLESGGVLWESFDADEAFYEIIENRMPVSAPRNNPFGIPQVPARETLLTQRAWRDQTHGSLSSDGRYVYSIERLSFLGPFQNYGRGMTQHPLAPGSDNKLVAYELGSGKMKWQIDGARRDEAAIAPGAFFLGPPMPLGDQLFCLVESGGEIRLLMLEVEPVSGDVTRTLAAPGSPGPAQPRVVWEQRLIYPQHDIGQNPIRRLAGLSPAYDDGIVVCPTVAGAVVAVDVSRRMLLWGYHYDTNRPTVTDNRQAMMMAQMRSRYGVVEFDDDERWLDSVPIIADGHVLLTPRDSNELHCLSLVDGTVRWKKPRGQGLYVAAVHGGKVIVAGRTHLEAWRLADGEAAWKAPAPTGMPSGRGVRNDDRYHLPLETGDVVSVRLDDGRVVGRSKAPDGQPAGNLVVARGRLVWQTIDSVVALESAEAVARRIQDGLRQNPEDPELLALRGELRLHRGDEPGGLADLKQAARLQPDGRPRQVLAATFMDLLRNDFAKYRHQVDEIEALVGDPRLRLEYLRIHADGLFRLGERRAAFDAYLKLADLQAGLPEAGERELIQPEASLAIRTDRLVAARLDELFHAADEADRAHMTAVLGERLAAVADSENADSTRRLARLLGGLPVAETVRRRLVELLDDDRHTLELALELDRLRRSERPEVAASATARLAALWAAPPTVAGGEGQRLSREPNVRPLVDELRSKWADVACLDGLTGRELVAKWEADERMAALLAPPPSWSDERFEIASTDTRGFGNPQRTFPIEILDAAGPWAGRRLVVDQQRRFIAAHEGDGRELWKLSLAGSNPNSTVFFTGGYARALGHLLFVALDEELLAIDTLSQPERPRVLWKQPLFDELLDGPGDANRARLFLGGNVAVVGNRVRQQMTDRYGRPLGRLGPVTCDAVCFQSGSRIVAAEPLTGRVLWERDHVERGSELFGDEEQLVVVPPEGRQGLVLRMRDGARVAAPALPASAIRTTLGSTLVTWERAGGEFRLRRQDAATGRELWSVSFADGARIDLAGSQAAAVLEPDGRFRILSLADGRAVVDERLAADPAIAQITLRRSFDRWLLLTYNPTGDAAARNARVMAATVGQPMVNGAVHAFDATTGRPAWSAPLERTYGLDLTQPHDSPVLVLAVQSYQVAQAAPRPAGNLFAQNQHALALLDTRHGEMIHEEVGPIPTVPFDVVLDPAGRRIEVQSPRLRLVLRQATPEPAEALGPPAPVGVARE